MRNLFRTCYNCNKSVHVKQKQCKHCGVSLKSKSLKNTALSKTVTKGRPLGTTASAGYSVSNGRPTGTTTEAGYDVSKSGGRPTGTTAEAGYDVSKSGGRPTGTTAEAGYDVSKAGGRPTGTTTEAGYDVSKSGGRPTGTTAKAGYDVSKSGGRPTGTSAEAGYDIGVAGGRCLGAVDQQSRRSYTTAQCQQTCTREGKEMCTNQEVEEQWCTDSNVLNVSEEKLKRIKNLIVKQKKFDSLPLGKAVCWKCGKILYSTVDNSRTCLIPPPKDVTIEKAPGDAYLKALPYEHKLTFIHTNGKWYSCPVCKKGKAIPTDQHGGDVHLPPTSNRSKVSEKIGIWSCQEPLLI